MSRTKKNRKKLYNSGKNNINNRFVFLIYINNIPIILFQNEEYSRPLYFKMEESPFFVAKSQLELESIIESLNKEKINENCKQILDFYGTYESGKAAEFLAKRINDEYYKRNISKVE